MKTAIYIENGDTQLVLTPENEWEKNVITSINKGQESVKIFSGSFYECRGGYHRSGTTDESLILRVGPPTESQQ